MCGYAAARIDARNTNRADGTGNTVSVVNVVSPLAVLHVAANWPLTTAVSEANETVNRGAATPWFNPPACSPFLVYWVYFVV